MGWSLATSTARAITGYYGIRTPGVSGYTGIINAIDFSSRKVIMPIGKRIKSIRSSLSHKITSHRTYHRLEPAINKLSGIREKISDAGIRLGVKIIH